MIIRSNTQQNDWMIGQGVGSYKTGEAAIEQNVLTTLLSWVGDCYFNLSFGVDYLNLMGPGQQAALALSIQIAVLGCFGVVNVNSISFSYSPGARSETINLDMETIYTRSATLSIQIPSIGVGT